MFGDGLRKQDTPCADLRAGLGILTVCFDCLIAHLKFNYNFNTLNAAVEKKKAMA